MDNKKITFHTNIKKTATQQPIETTWCVFASDYNSVQVEFVVADLRPDEIRTVNPTIILIMEDGSTVQRTKEQIVQKKNVFSYKLKDNEGKHIGVVKTQLRVETITGEKYQTNIYTFTILESLDSVPVPKEFVIDDIQNILQEVKHHITHVFKDEIERERVFKEYVANIQLSEKQREKIFNQSQQTRAILFQVFKDEAQEVLKDAQQVKDLFDELTETGVIETNIREKLGELETSYAPRLSTLEQNDVSLTAQLQQTEQELSSQLAQIAIRFEDFGGIGDGVTDNYDAFVSVTDYVNSQDDPVTLIFDNKKYFVEKYRISGGPNANGVKLITFENVNGLTIEGNGAEIIFNGNFTKSKDNFQSPYWHSYSQPIGLVFSNCDNLTINNLNVDNQVHLMSRESGLNTDGGQQCIALAGCVNVLLENVHVKRSGTDGFALFPDTNTLINGKYKINRNIVFRNCTSLYNARQGLTAGHFKGLYIDNCDFSYTGKAGGSYGVMFPGCGIDFELDYSVGVVEEISSNATIVNSRLENNFNTLFITNQGWKNITFKNTYFKNDYSGPLNDLSISGVNTRFIDCEIDIVGNIRITRGTSTNDTDITIQDSKVKCDTLGSVERPDVIIHLKRNEISGMLYFVTISKLSTFSNNDLIYSGTAPTTEAPAPTGWYLQGFNYSKDNVFRTNLDFDSSEGKYISITYSKTDLVVNDLFTSGKVRTWFDTVNTAKLYSKGLGS